MYDSLLKCDVDIHQDLLNNIVLGGGNTMFEGMAERIEKEIRTLNTTSMQVQVIAPPERRYSAWIGGSVLASLSTFPQMCISKAEYEEFGPILVRAKCF